MSRSLRAFRSTVVVSALGYAAQGLSLVAIPLFLKTVGAEGYGLMVTVMAFMGYLNFADAGLSWGSMILVAQADGRRDRAAVAHIVRHSALLALGSGLVVVAAVTVILSAASLGWRFPMFAGHPESDRLLLIAGAQLALNLQFGVVYNLFQGLQEGYWTGVYSGLGRLAGLAASMIAAWTTGRVDVMMLAQFGCTAAAGIAAYVHAARVHPWAVATGPWTDRAQYAAQLRVGGKNFLLQIGRTLGGTAPTLAISSIIGPAAVPAYTVPLTLITMFFSPITSWNASMQSAYGEAWESGDRDWVRTAFRATLERALLLGGLGLALFLPLSGGFIELWTHGRLQVTLPAAVSIAAIASVSAVLSAGQFLLTGLNRHRRAALAELCNGILALLLVPLFVHLAGLAAVGAGVVIAALLTSGWMLWTEISSLLGRTSFPAGSFLGRIFVAIAGGGAAAGAVFHGTHLGNPILSLFAGLTAGVGAYFAIGVGLKLVGGGDVQQLRGLLRRRLEPRPANGELPRAPERA